MRNTISSLFRTFLTVYLILSCQILFANQPKQQTIIKISSDSEDIQHTKFRGYHNLWMGSGSTEGIVFEENGLTFSLETEYSDNIMTMLGGVNDSPALFLESGDQLNLSVKDSKYTIEGSNLPARQNRLYQEIIALQREVVRYHRSMNYYQKKIAEGKVYKKPDYVDVDNIYARMEQLLAMFIADNSDCSESFKRFCNYDIKYFKMVQSLDMPKYKSKTYHPFSDEDLKLMDDCLGDSKVEEALSSRYYRQVLLAYMDYLRIYDPEHKLTDDLNWLENEIKLTDYIPGERTSVFVNAENLYNNAVFNCHRKEFYELAEAYAGPWTAQIVEFAKGMRFSKKGTLIEDNPNEFPQLKSIDVNGNPVDMKSLKGQWVYVDIWATWCGACVFEMRYLETLKQRLEDNNVAFVSLCVDKEKDRQKLLKFIAEKEMGGLQWQCNDIKSTYSELAINSIPHFAIIDPSGKMYMNRAPKPSSGILERYLKALAGPKNK